MVFSKEYSLSLLNQTIDCLGQVVIIHLDVHPVCGHSFFFFGRVLISQGRQLQLRKIELSKVVGVIIFQPRV